MTAEQQQKLVFCRKLQYFHFKPSAGVPFPRFCHCLKIILRRFLPPHKLTKLRNDKFQHDMVFFGGVPENKHETGQISVFVKSFVASRFVVTLDAGLSGFMTILNLSDQSLKKYNFTDESLKRKTVFVVGVAFHYLGVTGEMEWGGWLPPFRCLLSAMGALK